jgi:hypothetical protein
MHSKSIHNTIKKKGQKTMKDVKKAIKETKKAIYARYGIEYKSGKILSPLFGWINPVLVNGNAKIGRGAYHYSQLPTNRTYHVTIDNKEYDVKGTCPCTCLDEKGKISCYATKGNYNYKSVIRSLAKKTLLAYNCLSWLERAIMAQIEADKIQLVRIHAAGDFFSVEYTEAWTRIVNAFPKVTFWTYTKNHAAEKAFDNCKNGNIVKSFLPNGKMNFGHCDHIIAMYNSLKASGKKVHICFCGIEKFAGIPAKHCTNCHSCAECDYVLFIEHSTDYKAEKDPLFPALVSLILSQETESKAA